MVYIIPAQSTVTCPRKGHVIGTVKRDIIIDGAPSLPMHSSMIDFQPGQEVIPGQPMECKICGARYAYSGKIHTTAGWLPDDPTEPVTR